LETNNSKWYLNEIYFIEIKVTFMKINKSEMEKISRPDMKPSDLKNQLADNIVNIAKEYVDDDEKYFPLGTLEINDLNYILKKM
jgi:hypothetical protein